MAKLDCDKCDEHKDVEELARKVQWVNDMKAWILGSGLVFVVAVLGMAGSTYFGVQRLQEKWDEYQIEKKEIIKELRIMGEKLVHHDQYDRETYKKKGKSDE